MSNVAKNLARRRLLRNAAMVAVVVPAALLAGCAPQPDMRLSHNRPALPPTKLRRPTEPSSPFGSASPRPAVDLRIDASPVKFFTIACLGGSPEESNDTYHLGGKLGVVRQLEGRSNATRARSLHTALVDPGGVRIALLVRCVVSAGRIGKRSRTTGSITCIVVATCGGAGDTSCNRPSTPSALERACQRW
jgi:hypothetical protein